MNEFDTLLTISELAIGLIGVTGIVAVFLTKGEMEYFDKIRFSMIVATGSSVAFLAFVPIWLSRVMSTEILVWRVSAVIVLCVAITGNILIGYFTREFWQKIPKAVSGNTIVSKILASILTTMVFLLVLVNLASWPVPANGTFHEIVLFLGLLQMAFTFSNLVMSRGSGTNQA